MIASEVIQRLRRLATQHNLKIETIDNERPWGGEFIFAPAQVAEFATAFFPKLNLSHNESRLAIPKFLIIAPHQRFSWQYHRRRGEVWAVVEGPVGAETSMTDKEPAMEILATGDWLEIKALMRHRLVGQANWGVVAELWVHSDPHNPSVETDNVRLQDDYGRT